MPWRGARRRLCVLARACVRAAAALPPLLRVGVASLLAAACSSSPPRPALLLKCRPRTRSLLDVSDRIPFRAVRCGSTKVLPAPRAPERVLLRRGSRAVCAVRVRALPRPAGRRGGPGAMQSPLRQQLAVLARGHSLSPRVI